MMDVMPRYFADSDAFFGALVKAGAGDAFSAMMRTRIDKISRDLCFATDETMTSILKGQLSICYELTDGLTHALESRAAPASAADGEGFPGDEEGGE